MADPGDGAEKVEDELRISYCVSEYENAEKVNK